MDDGDDVSDKLSFGAKEHRIDAKLHYVEPPKCYGWFVIEQSMARSGMDLKMAKLLSFNQISLEKIISNKGSSKDLQKWYHDEKGEEEDEKDDEKDELWTPKSNGTSSKCLC
nr:hypothetical protein [Tanacetum cinerariifolium]